MNRLAHQQLLYNTLCNWSLSLYFSKPVMRHLVHMMDGIMHKGCSGTLTAHRTTLSHFLSRGVWDESVLQHLMQKQAHRQAKQNPHEPGMTATNVPFSDGLLSMRKQQTVSMIEFIYYETKQGMSLEDIKKRLQAA